MSFKVNEEELYLSDEISEKEPESIYADDGPESMLDSDGVSPEEEAFMRGYMEE